MDRLWYNVLFFLLASCHRKIFTCASFLCWAWKTAVSLIITLPIKKVKFSAMTATAKIPTVTKFCYCLELRTGGLITGWLDVVSYALVILVAIGRLVFKAFDEEKEKEVAEFTLVGKVNEVGKIFFSEIKIRKRGLISSSIIRHKISSCIHLLINLVIQGIIKNAVLQVFVSSVLLAFSGLFVKGIYDVSYFNCSKKVNEFSSSECTEKMLPLCCFTRNNCVADFFMRPNPSRSSTHNISSCQSLLFCSHLLSL